MIQRPSDRTHIWKTLKRQQFRAKNPGD